VPLHRDSHARGFCAYEGGDYFEFRHDDAAGRWRISQSAEDRLHDPAHVVGSGPSIQEAADDFTATSRRAEARPYVPTVTQSCDLTAGSIDVLVSALGEAVRLGYHDALHNHPERTANLIGDALGLARWYVLQQLPLRHAYMAGREHVAVERIHRSAR
jgi:hypothetical protein